MHIQLLLLVVLIMGEPTTSSNNPSITNFSTVDKRYFRPHFRYKDMYPDDSEDDSILTRSQNVNKKISQCLDVSSDSDKSWNAESDVNESGLSVTSGSSPVIRTRVFRNRNR